MRRWKPISDYGATLRRWTPGNIISGVQRRRTNSDENPETQIPKTPKKTCATPKASLLVGFWGPLWQPYLFL